jgi:hypothetical protein
MTKGERGVRVDGMQKALRIVEDRSFHHFRVESGGGGRKGERGVHLQRNEGGHHPLERTEGRGLDKNQVIEILITHININFHSIKKPWWEFIDTAKLVRTLRSISLEYRRYNE